jgi:hypothetical protein
MDRGRVGDERGSKEMDGCPLTDGLVFIREVFDNRLCEDVEGSA